MVVLTAMCASFYAAVLIPFMVVPIIPGVTHFRPANALPVVCSFLFGPAAAWGCGDRQPDRRLLRRSRAGRPVRLHRQLPLRPGAVSPVARRSAAAIRCRRTPRAWALFVVVVVDRRRSLRLDGRVRIADARLRAVRRARQRHHRQQPGDGAGPRTAIARGAVSARAARPAPLCRRHGSAADHARWRDGRRASSLTIAGTLAAFGGGNLAAAGMLPSRRRERITRRRARLRRVARSRDRRARSRCCCEHGRRRGGTRSVPRGARSHLSVRRSARGGARGASRSTPRPASGSRSWARPAPASRHCSAASTRSCRRSRRPTAAVRSASASSASSGSDVGALAGRIAMVFQDFEAQLFSTNVRLEVAFGPGQLGVAARRDRGTRRARARA